MKDFFSYDIGKPRNSVLVRARHVALTAIQRYGLEWEQIQFIQWSDAITYKIVTSVEEKFLLRIHPNRWSREEIASELELLQTLNQTQGLHVPEGIKNSDAAFIEQIRTEEGYQHPYVTLMRWVEGEHLNKDITESMAYQMGVMTGKLHHALAQFKPSAEFTRPSWGADRFQEEFLTLEPYYPRFLTSEAWRRYQDAAEKVVSTLVRMPRSRANYGMIHGDLHIGNIIIHNDQPQPIDFGRCGYGHYLYDVASTLLGLHVPQRISFIEGYEHVRPLKKGDLQDVECFFIMNLISNYCHHAPNESEIVNLIGEQPYAQAYIREYLRDASFLFVRVEPVSIDECKSS
ncbi:phosphotransferase enzyme family protein [Paenibacillus tundrae]